MSVLCCQNATQAIQYRNDTSYLRMNTPNAFIRRLNLPDWLLTTWYGPWCPTEPSADHFWSKMGIIGKTDAVKQLLRRVAVLDSPMSYPVQNHSLVSVRNDYKELLGEKLFWKRYNNRQPRRGKQHKKGPSLLEYEFDLRSANFNRTISVSSFYGE